MAGVLRCSTLKTVVGGVVVYRLPVGISDFKEIRCLERRDSIYYIDKTPLVDVLMQEVSAANLITRPIRFMKSTNLSMLKYFFDIEDAADNQILFDDLAIKTQPEYQETWQKHQGQYPVIFFSLKNIRGSSWEEIQSELIQVIKQCYMRHPCLGTSPSLAENEQLLYQAILTENFQLLPGMAMASSAEIKAKKHSAYKIALLTLTEFLAKHYQRKVIVLVDEYDKPLHIAYQHTDPKIRCLPHHQQRESCFSETIAWMVSFFESGLKDNIHVRKAVITGVLRTAFTSLLSSLNHISIYSVLSSEYAEYFGVTEGEIPGILTALGFEKTAQEQQQNIKKWYNGYKIGKTLLHNPWSIARYLTHVQNDPGSPPAPYWLQVGDGSLIGEFGRQYYYRIEKELIQLLKNSETTQEENVQPVIVGIDERTMFSDLDKRNLNAFWGLLLHTGFLTIRAKVAVTGTITQCSVAIPNFEIAGAYRVFILRWFEEANAGSGIEFSWMLESLMGGNLAYFASYLSYFILNTMSYFDQPSNSVYAKNPNYPEQFYHIFMVGLLAGLQDYGYRLQSNHESGLGRYDLMLTPKDPNKHGIIFEFKVADTAEKLEACAHSALKQIVDKQYSAALVSQGIKRGLHIGIAFFGKELYVAHEWQVY
jgi:hypothetical protein